MAMNQRHQFTLQLIGGQDVLTEIVSVFFRSLLENKLLRPFFINSDEDKQTKLQRKFLIKLMDGSQGLNSELRGRMQQVHKSLGLTDAHFDEMQVLYLQAIEQLKLEDWIVQRFMDDIARARPMVLGYKAQVETVSLHSSKNDSTDDFGSRDQSGDEKKVKTVIRVDPEVGMDNIYIAIGGYYSVHLVVLQMYNHLARDKELKPFYQLVDVHKLLKLFEKFLVCALNDKFPDGMLDRMKAAHIRLNLSRHHYDLFRNYLKNSLKHFELPKPHTKFILRTLDKYLPYVLPHLHTTVQDNDGDQEVVASDVTLLQHIGGENAIDLVVESFLHLVLDNAILAPYFTGINMQKQHQIQKRFLMHVLEGREFTPAALAGMKKAHQGMELDDVDFDQFKSVIKRSFAKLTLMKSNILKMVMEALESYRDVIVE